MKYLLWEGHKKSEIAYIQSLVSRRGSVSERCNHCVGVGAPKSQDAADLATRTGNKGQSATTSLHKSILGQY